MGDMKKIIEQGRQRLNVALAQDAIDMARKIFNSIPKLIDQAIVERNNSITLIEFYTYGSEEQMIITELKRILKEEGIKYKLVSKQADSEVRGTDNKIEIEF